MDFLNDYATQIGDFLHWLSNPESTIPVAKLLQALAAIIGALISALGFYKAWRYAERKLGARLSEFLSREEEHLRLARKTVADIRDRRSAIKRDQPTIFSNHELRSALRHVRKRRFAKAETLLGEALARTTEREELANQKAALHGKQKAMAHLLLGAITNSQKKHSEALAHFQSALAIDEHDVEALEYVAIELLNLGNAVEALDRFGKLASVAEAKGDGLLQAYALRGCGRAHEKLPKPSWFNANASYKAAIEVFPKDGPPLDLAYIHELRGLANLKLPNNRQQAAKSFMDALVRYTALEHGPTADAKIAMEGVKRINSSLADLKNNGGMPTMTPDDGTSLGESLTGLAASANQYGKGPPGGERSN